MSELLPCPFCGGNARIVERDVEPQGDPWYGRKEETFVLCDCGACLFDGCFHEGFYDADTRAVEAWNKRAAESQLASLRAELAERKEIASSLVVQFDAERCKLLGECNGLREQHARDSAELRSLCAARDDARKQRDTLRAELGALRLGPIERSDGLVRCRYYIPLPGGWELQTKGTGSTFRIVDTKSGDRLAVPDSPHLHETLERMAREIHSALVRIDGEKA